MIHTSIDFGDTFARLDKYADRVKGEVLIAGAAAAAKVFYDEVKARAPVNAGTLRDSIYRVFAKDSSTDARKNYEIGWNRKKAPHGHLVEFGTVKMAARPFLRPALAMAQAAIAAGQQRMREKLLEIKL
jgi:HK97 gp10 family phage protein